uniref:DH domain-containing protein n=1 Tax=Mesocestoides corti TaxID=53468 RepID=A0A5K3F905_MESCO
MSNSETIVMTMTEAPPLSPKKVKMERQGLVPRQNLKDDETSTIIGSSDHSEALRQGEQPRIRMKEKGSRDSSPRKRSDSYGQKTKPRGFTDNRPRMATLEMTEIKLPYEKNRTSSFGQEDSPKFQQAAQFRRNSLMKRHCSNSAITISRGNSAGIPAATTNHLSPSDDCAFIEMTTKPVPSQRSWIHYSETVLNDGQQDWNSRLNGSTSQVNSQSSSVTLRQKVRPSITPDRTSGISCASWDQKTHQRARDRGHRHRLGRMFARSTPSINTEENLQAVVQMDNLMTRLKAFENGNLPKIPQELLSIFPQNLPRHDFSMIEKIWSKLTTRELQESNGISNSSNRKTKDQQLSAIMELLHTEACYLKTLEMIIDVHVAVYIDLTKSSIWSTHLLYHGASHDRLVHSLTDQNLLEPATTSGSGLGFVRERIRSVAHLNRLWSRGGPEGISSSSSSLSNLSAIPLGDLPGFPATTFENIFGNIGAIYAVNHRFWIDCFEPCLIDDTVIDVKHCIRSMRKTFSQFKSYFHPYVDFMETYGTLVANIKYLDENNKLFAAYHEWTKSNNTLHSRESLTGLLAQPFQRLTRYGILLRRIEESTADEYEISALEEMLAAVDDFVREVDFNHNKQDAATKLSSFIKRISKYAYAETVRSDFNVDLPFGSTDIVQMLQRPMKLDGRHCTREPIAEVQAKVKCLGGKVSDALCVLLTDMVLICEQSISKKHLSVYRPPIALKNLTILRKRDHPGSYVGLITNDLGLLVESYLLTSEDRDFDAWVSLVNQQKDEVCRLMSLERNSSSGSMQSQMLTPDCYHGRHSLPPRNEHHRRLSHDSSTGNRGGSRGSEFRHLPPQPNYFTLDSRPQPLLEGIKPGASYSSRPACLRLPLATDAGSSTVEEDSTRKSVTKSDSSTSRFSSDSFSLTSTTGDTRSTRSSSVARSLEDSKGIIADIVQTDTAQKQSTQ